MRAEFVHPGSRRLRRRRLTTLGVLIVVGGSVGLSAGYAIYLRSDHYRLGLSERLSERLGVTIEMSDVRRRGIRGVELIDPCVSLGGGGPRVLQCRSAIWRFADDGLTSGFVLDLVDGWMSVGGAEWSKSRYGELLQRSLGQDFSALRVGQVRVQNVDLRFTSPFGDLTAGATHGVVDVRQPGEAVASLNSAELNGVPVDQPINISARFTPGPELKFSNVRLTVPKAPIAAVGLAGASATTHPHGTFAGTIRYERDAGEDVVTVVGAITDADLAVLSRLPGGPYRGKVTLDLQEARLSAKSLRYLSASGAIKDLFVADLFPSLAADAGAATLSLVVGDLRVRDGRIEYLQASGRCDGLSLEALTGLIGPGRVTGTVRIDIANLLIVDDQIAAADLLFDAVKPGGAPGTIDRTVLAKAANAWLGVDVADWMPPAVEYERLGARVVVTSDGLRFEGTHGPANATILTVRLLGRPLAVLAAPDKTYPVPDLRALLLERTRKVDRENLRHWWGTLRSGKSPDHADEDDPF